MNCKSKKARPAARPPRETKHPLTIGNVLLDLRPGEQAEDSRFAIDGIRLLNLLRWHKAYAPHDGLLFREIVGQLGENARYWKRLAQALHCPAFVVCERRGLDQGPLGLWLATSEFWVNDHIEKLEEEREFLGSETREYHRLLEEMHNVSAPSPPGDDKEETCSDAKHQAERKAAVSAAARKTPITT